MIILIYILRGGGHQIPVWIGVSRPPPPFVRIFAKLVSSLAQEEIRSISENVTWGQRKRFADGNINLPYKQFLGYEKGENGFPKIVESEAKIVRQIYDMFYYKGKTPSSIAKHLTEQGIPTPAGKSIWQSSTV